IKAGDEPKPDWVVAGNEHDRDRRRRGLGCEAGDDAPGRDDDGHLTANQVGRQRRQLIVLTPRPAVFNRRILTFDVTAVLEALMECFDRIGGLAGRSAAQESNYWQGLLRARREWPRCYAAECGQQFPPCGCVNERYHATSVQS